MGRNGLQAAENGYESPDDSASRSRDPPLQKGASGLRLAPPSAEVFGPPRARPRFPDRLASLDVMVSRARSTKNNPGGKVGLRDRIGCHKWSWFTMTMATGGIANVLWTVPFRPRWLTVVGATFFLFNIILFLANTFVITLRFRAVPGSLVSSFRHNVESLFVPAFVVSVAIILVNTCQYGIPNTGPWLVKTMEVLFWIYMGLSAIASTGLYLLLWSTQVFPLHTMTPVWVFPAYPLLLAAPFGTTLISTANAVGSTVNSLPIALCAVSVQGTGFLISFMVCAAFLYRLMTQKLPRDEQRPGVFISVGPSGFTVSGFVGLGFQSDRIFPPDFLGVENSPGMLKLLAYITGLFLWGLCFWFFLVSVGSLWTHVRNPNKLSFHITWFSVVFPVTAMITATLQLGRAFESRPLQVIACVLAGCVVLVWVVVFVSTVRGVWNRHLLWPDEQKEEGTGIRGVTVGEMRDRTT